jgi:hypothetical protein
MHCSYPNLPLAFSSLPRTAYQRQTVRSASRNLICRLTVR